MSGAQLVHKMVYKLGDFKLKNYEEGLTLCSWSRI